jgi:DNA-binding IclR family transcriptional regulator
MADRPTLISSVQRALHLVDAVGSSRRPPTAKALARLTGLALPTTYHLLRTLVHEGYLERREGGYVLGGRLHALSSSVAATTSADRADALRQRVWPALRWLHDGLRAAAYLAIYTDGEVRLVDIVDSPASPRVDLWVDLQVAGHATALGKAVLTALDDDGRREYLSRHDLADLTPYTLTDRGALLRALADNPLLALDRQEYQLGAACVAIPVQSPAGPAAVAVSVPTPRLPRLLDRTDELTRAARLVELSISI